MAQRADALALDGKDMSDRNAAIWFSSDGFNPSVKGINGRRVAGESFVRGFLRNAVVDDYVSL